MQQNETDYWVRLDAEGAKISCLALYAWVDD